MGGVPPSVRTVNLAGEPLATALVDQLYALGTVERVNDLYGPSEDTTYSTWSRRVAGAPPTIGAPIANTRAFVLDADREPVPVGVPGELHLGGAGLARGYLGQPVLTAERFVERAPFGRLYRTGDRVRWRDDGLLEYLGRLDHQVKIRGFRVELGEIESRLRAHREILDAAATVREDDGERRLVAYLVAKGAALSTAALREHLLATLPDYMVPSAFVWLEAMPQTPNGKVDRKALPAPQLDRVMLSRPYTAPATAAEVVLADVWSRVLRVERVGVDDNFFELGGDSILMIQIVSRARQAGLALAQRDIFANPTVGELARVARPLEAVVAASPPTDAADGVALPASVLSQLGVGADEVEDAYPLSPMQQGLLFHELSGTGGAEYHIQVRLTASGPLDPAAYRAAWQEVVRRHAVLRTAFVWEGVPEPLQVVLHDVEPEWREEDWRGLDDDTVRARLEQLLADDRSRGLALTTAPLMRLALLRTGDERYEVMWSLHHLLLDGWSAHAVLHEVEEVLAARRAGRPVPADPPRPYRDYIATLTRDPAAEAFWRERLAGFTTPTRLELGPSSGQQAMDERYRRVARAIGADRSSALQAFGREQQVTLNTVVQGAWAVVLGRYTGDRDVLFGATVTTRPSSLDGVDRMVGLFLNSIPVRVQLRDTASTPEWLRSLQREQSETRAHEATPLADIQRWSELAQGTALFDSLLVFENYPVARRTLTAGGVSFGGIEIIERTHYPLTLVAIPGAQLELRAIYDATRFHEAAVERLLAHLETVLADIADRPAAKVGEVAMLTADERRSLLALGDGGAAPTADATVHALFDAIASAQPRSVALTTDDATMTYEELAARVHRLARFLRRHEVGPGQFVGLAMRPSVELIVAMLATLEAGAAFVPLDPALPAERLAYLLDDIAAPVLLTQRGLLDRLPARPGTRALVMDDIAATVAEESDAPLGQAVHRDDAAYVMYTSGSTGRPKGVVVPHRAIVRLVRDNRFMHLGPGEVLLMLAPVSFDASTLEIWGALLNGGRLAIPTGPTPPIERLGALIREHGVTSLWLTAALFRHVVDTDIEALRPLKQLLAGGDVLPPEQVRRVVQELPHVRLINGYGPTENTTFTCCHTVTAADVGRPIPIGRPIGGTTVYVLDPEMRPVPTGVAGELWAGGDGVALGYLHQPALTAERFVDSPFRAGERLYRTGDRVRWRSDGAIEFLGRLDGQVKLRGFRVEPEEVESALASHPGLRAAVVTVREDRPGDKRLVAYGVARTGDDAPDATALRAYLADRLPEYMVPSAFVLLDALPVTANGKVDRRALPAPAAFADDASERYVAPRTAVESMLARIWADVLRLERVGVNDNYYELGGDSILAIQIAARARASGLPVSVSSLVKHPTVAALAATVAVESIDDGAATRAADAPVTGRAPLTPIQHWFFELDPAERDHWNQAFLFRTQTELDDTVLRDAIGALLEHHDALRLRFERAEDGWTQHFSPLAGEVPLWVEDLSELPDAALPGAIAAAADRAARSLDIRSGPVLRAVHLRLGHGRGGRLLFVIHHLVVDGISWRILLEDLESAYQQRVAEAPVQLPPRTSSFQAWAAALEAQVRQGALEAERAYWHEVSAGSLLRLPVADEADHANTIGESGTVVASLDASETTALLQRVPAAYATQVNDVLLVALADALAPWAGVGALLLDLEGHGREEVGAELDLTRTVGWFTSVFPVRLPLGGSDDVALRIKRIKEMLRQVPRRGVGYGSLRYLAGDPLLASRPGAQLVFNYLGQFDQLVADSTLLRFAAEDAGPWLSPAGRRRHLLEINSLVLDGRLEFRWTFGRRLHDEGKIREVAQAMLQALRAIIAHCTAPGAGGRTPSDFPLVSLDQAQVDRLVGDGRDVEEIGPLAPLQSLFLTTSGGASDVGVEQWRYELEGPLDSGAFATAWRMVAARHEILRATFHSAGLAEPVQVIHRAAELPMTTLDWRGLEATERESRLATLLAEDRARGFRVDRAPLMRLTLVRTADTSYTLLWSNHHLLLDRWSWPLVLAEVGAAYAAVRSRTPPSLPPATPWRRYLAHLAERDGEVDETFWRTTLAGVRPMALPRLVGAGGDDGERRLELTTDATARLHALSRELRRPVGVLVSAAWALWLAGATRREDVVVGLTVAGRPEELPGVERLVGMCINNVPLRVRVEEGDTLAALLARIDDAQRAADRHAAAPLTSIQQWSGVPAHQRLFGTLLVHQHHGADESTERWLGAEIDVGTAPVETRTAYPLALVVSGRAPLVLRLSWQGRHAGAVAAERILAGVHHILTEFSRLGNGALAPILRSVAPIDSLAEQGATGRVRVPPAGDVEWVVARTWAELLGRDEIGADENFFDLGGQSLVATQIISRLRDGLQQELPISLLFEHPTVQAFAAAVQRRETTPGAVRRIAAIIRRVEEMTDQELGEVSNHG